MTREEILGAARRLIGVRFAHQGRSAREGLDCLGLLLAIAQAVGLPFEDRRDYGRKPDTDFLQQQLERYLLRVETKDIQVADVLLLSIDGQPQHLAMVTDYPLAGEWGMIHAYAPLRKVVEHRLSKEWQDRIHAVYRLPQLTAENRSSG